MEIMVEFILFSPDFPVEEVYRQIGLDGEIQRLSEKSFPVFPNGTHVREKESSITYSTGYIETIELGDTADKLIDMLCPREEQILNCIKTYQLQAMFCIVINLTENPIIELSSRFVETAARLQARIVFDSYVDYNKRGRITKCRTRVKLEKNKKRFGK